eukprot:scaffold43718_cov48-Phaeocystis_antarctica.AAC.3
MTTGRGHHHQSGGPPRRALDSPQLQPSKRSRAHDVQLHDLPAARVARLGGASAVDHHVRRVHARVVAPPPAQVAAHLPARAQ